MAFWKKLLKNAIPGLLALSLCMTLLPIAAAAEDTIVRGTKGSITVTKYASTDPDAQTGDATGTTGDANDNVLGNYSPLKGAQFRLYKIADEDTVIAYYAGNSSTVYSIDNFDYDADTGAATYDYGTEIKAVPQEGTDQTTDESGVCSFDNLGIGIYALKEIGVDENDQISTPTAVTSLIAIPMAINQTIDGTEVTNWEYDIHVYPKNTATAKVQLTVNDMDESHKLAGVTFKLFKKNGDKWEAIKHTVNAEEKEEFTTGDNGMITAVGLSAGDYKLVATDAPDGYILNTYPLYFTVNSPNSVTWDETINQNSNITYHTEKADPAQLEITMLLEKLDMRLKVHRNGNDGNEWKQDEQYSIGKTYSNKLEVYIPRNFTEVSPYTITVSLADGISLSDTSISGTGYNGSIAEDRKSFTVVPISDAAGKTLSVLFDTYLNADAEIAGVGNDCTATVQYAKEIREPAADSTTVTRNASEPETYTLTDSTRVYTFDFEVTKRQDTAQGSTMQGVEFKLFHDADAKSEVGLIEVESGKAGQYRPVIGEERKADVLVSDANGHIYVKGLEKGDYYLKETKTASGYNLLSAPFHMDLNIVETTTWTEGTAFADSTFAANTYEETGYKLGDNAITATKQTADIINKKGFTLPRTGSMGYLLFCTVGILLIGGGAALLFGGRKKKIR